MTAPQTRLMLADELENLRMLDARAGYAFKCADNIETIIAALRATEPARSPPGSGALREAWQIEQLLKPYIDSALNWHEVFDDGRGGNDLTKAQTSEMLCRRFAAALPQSSTEGRREEIAREALEEIKKLYVDAPGFAAPTPTGELVFGMYAIARDAILALCADTHRGEQS